MWCEQGLVLGSWMGLVTSKNVVGRVLLFVGSGLGWERRWEVRMVDL